VGNGDPVDVNVKLKVFACTAEADVALVMAGGWVTVSLKLWVVDPPELAAVMVIVYVPPVPALGVPAIVAVPSPLLVKVSPAGRLPVSERLATGDPVVLTVNPKVAPTEAVADAAVVIAGAPVTVRVNDWVVDPAELVAVMVIGKTPLVLAGPVMSAVPSPLLLKLTPRGSAPDSFRLVVMVADCELAAVVTVKSKLAFTANDVDAALVNTGTFAPVLAAALTVRVKDCVVEPPVLVALMVMVVVLAAAVPAMEAVPFPLSVNLTPEGSAPVSLSAAVGYAVVLTVKVKAVAAVSAAVAGLVMVGAWATVSTNA
jgi:hypothetical protein